jgi:hypothetical protein
MHSEIAKKPSRAPGLAWPFLPVFIPFWYAWITWCWWTETREQLRSAAGAGVLAGAATSPEVMASVALLARLLAALSEGGAYALWWRSRGARLPYWRFLCWIVGLSAADLLGFALRRAAADASAIPRTVCVVLAGPAALDSGVASGAATAFGGLGVLTLLRIGMTGWAQARGAERPLAGPLILTSCAWLLTRLAGWWSFDLLRGLSPVR